MKYFIFLEQIYWIYHLNNIELLAIGMPYYSWSATIHSFIILASCRAYSFTLHIKNFAKLLDSFALRATGFPR